MEYEELKLLKQSEKSIVYLIQEKDGEQVFVRKILKGQRDIYSILKNCQHPYLPRIYEVIFSDDSTTIIEEYIEGQSLGSAQLSEKQLRGAFKELCTVLEELHEKDIIHRDIKPSNIMLAKDGHIRLIDFDAARMPKDDLEQDTRLLGTRGYAPPEQYGFAQTDARADIYALGITMKQLLGNKALKLRYRRMIQKCTNLNPDKRYQSVRQVKRALSNRKYFVFCVLIALLFLGILWIDFSHRTVQQNEIMAENETAKSESDNREAENLTEQFEDDEPIALPAPDNPHWDGETGVAIWGNVPESGNGGGEVGYHWRLYRRDTATPPDPEADEWDWEGGMRGNGAIDEATATYSVNIASELWENGYYYFAVSADGDGVNYADSPYVISDAFEYTGEFAPELPAPTGLQWRMFEAEKERMYYATWSNLDDYEDADSFNVTVYDKDGNYVMNNIWTKEMIMDIGHGGIQVREQFLTEVGGAYRFTVEAYTSRPNEYKSFLMPDPIPEEYFSPWYYR